MTLALSTAAISATLWFWQPGVETYRGLSGIDSALFALLVGAFFREAMQNDRPRVALACLGLLVGFVAKVGYELATGATLFVDSSAAGFTPLPLVHLVGAACGLLVAYSDRPGMIRGVSWSNRYRRLKARLCSTLAAKAGTRARGISIPARIERSARHAVGPSRG